VPPSTTTEPAGIGGENSSRCRRPVTAVGATLLEMIAQTHAKITRRKNNYTQQHDRLVSVMVFGGAKKKNYGENI
jgi:hypothetical protein